MQYPMESLRQYLFPKEGGDGGIVAAILNPYRWPGLVRFLSELDTEWLFLYKGEPPRDLYDVIPYLVLINEDGPLLQKIIESLDEECAVFIKGNKGADLVEMAFSIAGLSYVDTPEYKNVWLRYYEPYVLQELIKVANEQQSSKIFGKYVHEFIIPNIYSTSFVSMQASQQMNHENDDDKISLVPSQIEKIQYAQERQFLQKAMTMLVKTRSKFVVDLKKEELERQTNLILNFAEKQGITEYEVLRDVILLSAEFGWDWPCWPKVAAVMEGQSEQNEKLSAFKQHLHTFGRNRI